MAELAPPDDAQHAAALRVMHALHVIGFSRVWLDDVLYFTGGAMREGVGAGPEIAHHHLRIVIDEGEIAPDRFAAVLAIASDHGATAGLTKMRLDTHEFTRLTLWPKGADDGGAA
jgi:hypothetical protein